jgi:hypothetical protein
VAEIKALPSASAVVDLRKSARKLQRLLDGSSSSLDSVSANDAANISTHIEALEQLLKPYHRKPAASAKPVAGELTTTQLEVLQWVAVQKFATTSHVRDYYQVADATDQLRHLEVWGLLHSTRYEPHKGRQSQNVYWLSSRGAAYLTNHGNPTRHESRFAKTPPDYNQVTFRTMELELMAQCYAIGWQVVAPQVFNSANKKKAAGQTEQATILANAVHNIEQAQLASMKHDKGVSLWEFNERQADFAEGKHLEVIPRQCNEYVAYVPNTNIVLVFILCPLDITQAFWSARLKQYEALATKVVVYGVFAIEEQRDSWKALLNTTSIGTAYFMNLGELLKDYYSSI